MEENTNEEEDQEVEDEEHINTQKSLTTPPTNSETLVNACNNLPIYKICSKCLKFLIILSNIYNLLMSSAGK